ncbi:hypothetical protein QBC39DRAFT_380021 [Podospora conica]|nr:hypothetical protein QBC39DRAFT_380021 [Schizothecium conicum]
MKLPNLLPTMVAIPTGVFTYVPIAVTHPLAPRMNPGPGPLLITDLQIRPNTNHVGAMTPTFKMTTGPPVDGHDAPSAYCNDLRFGLLTICDGGMEGMEPGLMGASLMGERPELNEKKECPLCWPLGTPWAAGSNNMNMCDPCIPVAGANLTIWLLPSMGDKMGMGKRAGNRFGRETTRLDDPGEMGRGDRMVPYTTESDPYWPTGDDGRPSDGMDDDEGMGEEPGLASNPKDNRPTRNPPGSQKWWMGTVHIPPSHFTMVEGGSMPMQQKYIGPTELMVEGMVMVGDEEVPRKLMEMM